MPRLFDLAAPLVACWSGHFASIQRDHQVPREEAPTSQQVHHLIEKSFHLFLGEFADGVRQAWGRERTLFLFHGAAGICAFGQPVFALVSMEADQLDQRQIAKQDARQFIHGLTAQQHFQERQQHKLHRGHQRPLHSRLTDLLKRFQHPQLFEKDQKFIEQSRIAQLMHLFDGFARIQGLPDLRIISPRHLPIESLLHHTSFLRWLFARLLVLHTFLPLPCSVFPLLTTFPLPPSLFPHISSPCHPYPPTTPSPTHH